MYIFGNQVRFFVPFGDVSVGEDVHKEGPAEKP